MTEERDPLLIDASPTKDLFIYMLVKDIPLVRAILDLIDNSMDGALRTRPGGDYQGLHITLTVDGSRLVIKDNCGGMPVHLARDYAFRFGRPAGMERTDHSVGQFGVGMKRAFFKLGTVSVVESRTAKARFTVPINVEDWKRDTDPEWHFRFSELLEDLPEVEPQDCGTTITVTPLHENVAKEFASPIFEKRLMSEISAAHQESMDKGLTITLNGVHLECRPAKLLMSDQLVPAYWTWKSEDDPPVTVRAWAGLAGSEPREAGWYIFCNGRLVLEADKTETTGWGEGNELAIPRYHNQFAQFRGYALFDCADAGLLPWNTTKTGVDADSPLFAYVRSEMIRLMRPVITFLNKLKEEREGKDESETRDEGPLSLAVAHASLVRLPAMQVPVAFVAPRPSSGPRPPQTGRIQYDRPVDDIKKVMERTGVRTYKDVGERTFDYYLKVECSEE